MTIHWINSSTITSTASLCDAVHTAIEDVVVLAVPSVKQKLSDDQINNWLMRADVVHSGLLFNSGSAFTSVQLCTFNWHFLNPSANFPGVSWKATLDFVAFEKRLLSIIGLIDERFENPNAALMDWVYRALSVGAKTQYQPLPDFKVKHLDSVQISVADEFLFITKHFNSKAQNFYRFCQFFLRGKIVIHTPVKRIYKYVESEFKLTTVNSNITIDSYAALIPTIDRYDYISKSIDSLLALKFPPDEIVVVDQTPKAKRKHDVYAPYLAMGVLKVVYLDQAGQSTARNKGLETITKEWVLLFEDDSEAWLDMVDEHISLIKASACDVSTGVIVPPGADRNFIPEKNRRYFLADILTTGNAFMTKETALSAGGFDPAFDRGPGADDDFGKRLYKIGKVIVYNYKSIETHHKAPMGGMRVHGIWWRNKSTLFGPYPPVTQSFVILKFYPRKFHILLFLNMILKARKKHSLPAYIMFFILLPYKVWKSVRQARQLSKAV